MRPSNTLGLRHLALTVKNLDACVAFYTDVLGMHIEWHPDADNIYLTTGRDNLALHRASAGFKRNGGQALDHFGFILKTPEEVDQWYAYCGEKKAVIKTPPKTHRDGARSFYCQDPEGNMIQMIYHPPLAAIE
jgi:catechol 2,3-dioxygenase-like lactoylglutathione lyase family enzyme